MNPLAATTKRGDSGFALLVLLGIIGAASMTIVLAVQSFVPPLADRSNTANSRLAIAQSAALVAFRRSGGFPATLDALATAGGLESQGLWRVDPYGDGQQLDYATTTAGVSVCSRGGDRVLSTSDDVVFTLGAESQLRVRQRLRLRLIRAVYLLKLVELELANVGSGNGGGSGGNNGGGNGRGNSNGNGNGNSGGGGNNGNNGGGNGGGNSNGNGNSGGGGNNSGGGNGRGNGNDLTLAQFMPLFASAMTSVAATILQPMAAFAMHTAAPVQMATRRIDRDTLRAAMLDYAIAQRQWLTATLSERAALTTLLNDATTTVETAIGAAGVAAVPTAITGAGGFMEWLGMPDSRGVDGIGQALRVNVTVGVIALGIDATEGTDDDM